MNVTGTRNYDFEYATSAAVAATDEFEKIIPGLRVEAPELGEELLGVQIVSINTDKGQKNGAEIQTVSFKALPQGQRDSMGGDIEHSFACIDSEARNSIPFGNILKPGEDLRLLVKPGTAGRFVRMRVVRKALFGTR